MSVPDHTSAPASNGCPSVDSNSGLQCNRERGHDGEHRAEARYGWTDPIDFSAPPAWAVEMAKRHILGLPQVMHRDDAAAALARLLASVREGALREAADRCGAIEDNWWALYDGKPPFTGREEGRAHPRCEGASDGAGECRSAILSLLTTPPREATR